MHVSCNIITILNNIILNAMRGFALYVCIYAIDGNCLPLA